MPQFHLCILHYIVSVQPTLTKQVQNKSRCPLQPVRHIHQNFSHCNNCCTRSWYMVVHFTNAKNQVNVTSKKNQVNVIYSGSWFTLLFWIVDGSLVETLMLLPIAVHNRLNKLLPAHLNLHTLAAPEYAWTKEDINLVDQIVLVNNLIHLQVPCSTTGSNHIVSYSDINRPNYCPCFLQWYQQATEYLPLAVTGDELH